ncbi:MAG: hypothetical protein JKY19_14000 [Alcanivoracaceae bacterium]|nr:hypothetical protein [Alcanivoracaceae bacterium]
MVLAIKKNRPIKVEGKKYQYQNSTTKIYNNRNYILNLTIQSPQPNCSILSVKGLVTRDYWLNFPKVSEHKRSEYPIITSKHILKANKKTQKFGCKPEEVNRF